MASVFSHRTAKHALSWKWRDNEPGAQPSSLDMAFFRAAAKPWPCHNVGRHRRASFRACRQVSQTIRGLTGARSGNCRAFFCSCFRLCFVHLVSCWIPRSSERYPLTRSEPEKVRTSAGFGRSFSASTVAVCFAVLFSLYVRFFLLFSHCQ
jgi:hypothetical protein